MKKLNYLLFSILILFSFMFYVDASCSNEEIAKLKDEASKIKVTYKHLGAVTEDGYIYYNKFELKFNNVNDDFYVEFLDGSGFNIKLYPSNGLIRDVFINGRYSFDVYSNKCDKKIDTLEVLIPRFNIYSLDSLCSNIDPDDFPLCGKYYEYEVSYEQFLKRVTHYRSVHNIVSDNNVDNNDIKEEKDLLNIILQFILKYKLYIFIAFIIFLIIFSIILIKFKRKRKSILQ